MRKYIYIMILAKVSSFLLNTHIIIVYHVSDVTTYFNYNGKLNDIILYRNHTNRLNKKVGCALWVNVKLYKILQHVKITFISDDSLAQEGMDRNKRVEHGSYAKETP